MSVSSIGLANTYANNPGLASAYVRMNGYTRVVVSKNRGGRGWDVWMMQPDDVGTYETLRTKSGAMMAAEHMGKVFGLPVSCE